MVLHLTGSDNTLVERLQLWRCIWWKELDFDGRILFGDVGRCIIYQQKDMSSVPAKPLIPLVQPMFKHNWSNPSIAAVVVIDLQLASTNSFPLQGGRCCCFANQEWWQFVSACHVCAQHKTQPVFGFQISGTTYSFITKRVSSIGESLVKNWFHLHDQCYLVHTLAAMVLRCFPGGYCSLDSQSLHQLFSWIPLHIVSRINTGTHCCSAMAYHHVWCPDLCQS